MNIISVSTVSLLASRRCFHCMLAVLLSRVPMQFNVFVIRNAQTIPVHHTHCLIH